MRISLTRLMAGFALALLALGTTAVAGVSGTSAASGSQLAREMVGMAERSALSGEIPPAHHPGIHAGMTNMNLTFDTDLPFEKGIEHNPSFSGMSGWIRVSAGSARIRTMYASSETCVTGGEFRAGVSIAKGFERLYASAWRDVA